MAAKGFELVVFAVASASSCCMALYLGHQIGQQCSLPAGAGDGRGASTLSRRGGKAMTVNTFWTIWLLAHLVLAVALLGASTHQAAAAVLPVHQAADGIVTRFRAVSAPGYATAVCILWVLTFIVGSYIYTKYRIYIRIPLEAGHYYKTQGFFDFKEHVATIGLLLLPGYWFLWKNAQNRQYDSARKMVTIVLAGMCWFLFIVGHVVNNTRGFAS
jgi:hypothetical protein